MRTQNTNTMGTQNTNTMGTKIANFRVIRFLINMWKKITHKLETKNISKDDFIEILAGFQGEIELDTSTKVRMNKGGRNGVELNPYIEKDVRKDKEGKYIFGRKYLDKINEALKIEGREAVNEDFLDKLPWGEYKIKDKVVSYNDAMYLRCYPIKDYAYKETINIDGVPATEDDLDVISKYIPEKKMSKKQEEVGITEENRVIPLLFNFDNINYAIIAGTKYILQ